VSWYTPVASVEGKGAGSRRPRSLGDLHAARRAHQGQFFTPEPVAELAWALVAPHIARMPRVSLFDNSIGTGRLLQYADPSRHSLYGVDVDAAAVEALSDAAAAAGFVREFLTAGLEDIRPNGFDVGLINPPFSLQLESPHLAPYPCTSWGRHGPHTSAVSHAYALWQALDACSLVVAILPASYGRDIRREPALAKRLAALVRLPAAAFAPSGARVSTVIALFDSAARAIPPRIVGARDYRGPGELARLSASLDLAFMPREGHGRIGLRFTDAERPSITLPVTGERRVRVAHDGRRIVLRFDCGLTEAKVRNAVLMGPVEPIERHRHPTGLRHRGELKLDVESHLATDDPAASFEGLCEEIRAAGGEPEVDPGLRRYLARRIREKARAETPFQRTILDALGPDPGGLRARPKRAMPLDPRRFGSPILSPAETYPVEVGGSAEAREFTVRAGGQAAPFDEEAFTDRFTRLTPEAAASAGIWRRIFPGKAGAFPALAESWRARARAMGLDKWLSWGYQFDDLIELAVNPRGGVVAWEPAMGKFRLALSLAMLHGGKHNLIVVEAGLIGEGEIELKKLGVDPALYQFLERPEQLDSLRRVNIISYERLRRPVPGGSARQTWARKLRRRLSTVVCDEADHLSHLDTAQTRALWMLSPKWRYALAGEPIANYPRDLLPLIAWAIGDGTAVQPYGYRHPYIEQALTKSAAYATRGVDTFRDRFVTLQWVTNAFAERLTDGAKREVPKIKNLAAFREFHAPHLLRRVTAEPDCAPHLPMPKWRCITRRIRWDRAHLAHYLTVAEEYRRWFEAERQAAEEAGRNLNMVAVLARIGAVIAAANHPFEPAKRCPAYTRETTKETAALERLEWLAAHGHKTILYAHSPALLERLGRKLAERGIEAVTFHGRKPVKARMRELDRRFRFGPAPVLLASLGVSQKGLNIPQANRVVFFNGSWSAKEISQAMKRVLRAQQKRRVLFEFLELEGSIDEYQAQMVAFKADAASSGVDWQDSAYSDCDFKHLDTILGEFCEDLAELSGVERGELREALVA